MSANAVSEVRDERTSMCVLVRREHRERLLRAARENDRSMGAEVRRALDAYFGLSPVGEPARAGRDAEESRMR